MVRNYLFLTLFIIASFLSSCSSGSENSEFIDYETLNELTARVAVEIGESEDYLPGRLRDLVVASDGTILVSDWANVSVQQFSADGEHIGTVAEEGGGPGELSDYFFMFDLGNDTLMIREQSRQKSFFVKSENGLFKHLETVSSDQRPERNISILGPALNGYYYATAEKFIDGSIQQLAKNEEDYRMMPLAIINAVGEIIEDSLHLLKAPMAHVTQIDNGMRINTVPYRYNDRFLLLSDNRYMIARPDSSAFFIYSRDHRLERRISFPVKERPVTSDDLDYVLKDVQSNVKNAIRNRIHDQKPPYLNAWTSDNFIWLQTDETEVGKEMIVVDLEGNPRGKFMLAEFDEVAHVEDDRIYTLHKNPERGESIRVYEVDV